MAASRPRRSRGDRRPHRRLLRPTASRRKHERRKLKQPVFIGELYLDRLYRQSLRQPAARELSRYQAVQRDFSFIFPDAVQWAEIAAALDALAIPELISFEAKEVLRDAKGRTRSAKATTRCCSAPSFNPRPALCAKRTCKATPAQSCRLSKQEAVACERRKNRRPRTISSNRQKQGRCYVEPPLLACFPTREKPA